MHELLAQLTGYAVSTWRYRWHALITAWIISIGGWISIHYIPDRYEATARVYVNTQSLLKPLLAGLAVQPNTNQQVEVMARTLISRPNLEKVARMTDLDLGAKNPAQMEAVINNLSDMIKLGSTGSDDYTISYQNKDPALAKKVVQSLLNIFVEGGLGSNRKDIASSQKFIEDQLKEYETKLNDAENALKDFKQRNIGLMRGETGQDYYSELADAKGQIDDASLALKEALDRRDSLKQQLSGTDSTLLDSASESMASTKYDARIASLNKDLDALRLKYTEQHPDVVATKRLIAQLEADKAKEAAIKKPSASMAQNPLYQQLNISLAEAEANVASMKARLNEYQSRYAQLRAAANRLPEVDAELSQLTRNYDVYKKNYDSLLARRESAQMSSAVDTKTDSVDFRVIDPPRVPFTPSYPKRPLLISLVLLGAIAAGIALAFLMSQIRPTINNRFDMHTLTDLPMLGMVSLIETQDAKTRARKGLRNYAAASLGLFGAYGVLLALQFIMNKGA
jgi:polysaccharide chain length determinant protein (PEP-CTERM system associated)